MPTGIDSNPELCTIIETFKYMLFLYKESRICYISARERRNFADLYQETAVHAERLLFILLLNNEQ